MQNHKIPFSAFMRLQIKIKDGRNSDKKLELMNQLNQMKLYMAENSLKEIKYD